MRTPLHQFSDTEIAKEHNRRFVGVAPVKAPKTQNVPIPKAAPAPLAPPPSEEHMVAEFITTVYTLATNRRWFELNEYFSLLRETLSRPRAVIIPGKPQDKEL